MRRIEEMRTASDSPNRRVSEISSFHQKPASTKKAGAYFLVYLRFSALICSQDFGFLRVAAPSSRKFIFAFFRG
jgi:hypothetical protein